MRSWGSSRIASNSIGYVKRVRAIRRAVRTLLYDERRDIRETENWRTFASEFPRDVVARYEEEIGALERLLGRDLSSWRIHPGAAARGQ